MPSGLINIISYGANDLYLTGSPQVTFFKTVYRRNTNFALESTCIDANNFNFGDEIEVIIPRNADLLSKIHLQIDIPSVSFLRSDFGISTTNNSDSTPQSNYDIIIQFMKINSEAYRTAYNDTSAINLPVSIMISDIIETINSFPSSQLDIIAYSNVLNTAYATYKYFWLFPDITNISAIVNYIAQQLLVNPTSWTKVQVLEALNVAIQLSQTVQQFFYDNLLVYNKTYSQETSQYAKFAWIERLGHFIIDYVDINIGGEKIDRHYGDWINIWYELTGNKTQTETYNKLIGNVSQMTKFNQNIKPKYSLYIPLSFWFCSNTGLTIPLIALRYNQVSLVIKFKNLEDCAYVEKSTDPDATISLTDVWNDYGYNLSGSVLVDYIYLDVLERKRFAQSAHEYLIERVQVMTQTNNDTDRISINLDFSSPCKELIWVAQKEIYVNNISYYKSLWGNYAINGDGTGNPFVSANLTFNGYDRFKKTEGNYFNYIQPYASHTDIPNDGINVYSFSIYPEEHQPSSTCNFSRIATATLYFIIDPRIMTYDPSDIDPSIQPQTNTQKSPYPAVWKYSTNESINTNLLPTTYNIRVYTRSYNIFRIIGGMGALAYY